MKRHELLRHLKKEGCMLFREGAKHSVFFNIRTKQISTIPRHREVDNNLAKKICRDLGVKEI